MARSFLDADTSKRLRWWLGIWAEKAAHLLSHTEQRDTGEKGELQYLNTCSRCLAHYSQARHRLTQSIKRGY